jgi:hypothetical protein
VIRITATVDADQATDAFKHARRDIYRRAKSGIKHAGERTILPKARRGMTANTPVVASQLVVKTTASDGYLTASRAKEGRKIGLLNFGGQVREPILPKDKKALSFGGIVVSQVNRARRYRGSHFLEKARDEGLQEFGQALLPEILLAFEPLEHSP